MDLKFDEFNEERKNKQKALTSGFSPPHPQTIHCADSSLEAPFIGSPRVMSETDASDSEQEDLVIDDIKVSDSSRNPPPPSRSRRDSLATTKRTGLSLPATRQLQSISPTSPQSTTPPPPVIVKENPRKRRRSELFTSGKENFLPQTSSTAASNLFSPDRTTATSTTTMTTATRGVLVESSPPRPSLVIPAGLTRLESPNKLMNVPVPPLQDKFTKEFEFAAEMGLDEDGGGRRTSRARKQVNYALPNLRDKMRREDRLEEGGKWRGRSLSMDRSVTPDFGVHLSHEWSLMEKNKEELSTVAFEMKNATVKSERQTSPVQQTSSQPPSKQPSSPSQPDKKATTKPRLSLIERQSLLNSSSRPSSTTIISADTNPPKKRRTSTLHKPLPPPSQPMAPSVDIFRFPSESPPKQPPAKPSHHPRPTKPPPSSTEEDKENAAPRAPPPASWPVVIGGRERRKTFNVTMEKLAQLTREEKQADRDWEAEIAAKRRRQSVAI